MLFREKGFDGVGLADIMKAAGLTHGGVQGHFGSKEDLEAQALSLAMARSLTIWSQTVDSAAARPRESRALPAGHPHGLRRHQERPRARGPDRPLVIPSDRRSADPEAERRQEARRGAIQISR